jgi:hypothetical protein
VTTQPSLTPAAFAAKWHGVTTTEKASAQITEQAARHVAEIAQSLRSRGHDKGTTLTDTHIA